MAFELKPLTENKTWRPGEIHTLAHHLTVRREWVIPVDEAEEHRSREVLICAALSGLCSNTDPIADAMKKEPGGSTVKITAVLSKLAMETADATMQLMKEEKK